MAIVKDLTQSSVGNFYKLYKKLTRQIWTKVANLEDILMKKIRTYQVESLNSVEKCLDAIPTQVKLGVRKHGQQMLIWKDFCSGEVSSGSDIRDLIEFST